MTGPEAILGTTELQGEQLAEEQINSAGGVNGRKFEISVFDDQCDATMSATVATRIISNSNFIGVLGPVCSGAALAALPVYARTKLEVVADVSNPVITQDVAKNHWNWFARLSQRDDAQSVAMATLAIRVLHERRVALLYSEDDYGEGLLQYIKPAIVKLGGTIVDTETFTPSTTKDFTAQLTKIAAAKPQAIEIMGYYSDTGIAVAQMARAGIRASVTRILPDSSAHPGFISLAGSAANGSVLLPFYYVNDPNPANVAFVKAFQARFHSLPDVNAVYGYDAMEAYIHAFENGATKTSLAQKIRSLDFVAPTGVVKFDPAGDLIGATKTVLKVVSGKMLLNQGLTTQLKAALGSSA
jgi:branched-chain amino acid transport system substrate-binding protein